MTTIREGNLVQQTQNLTVWRLGEMFLSYNEPRWRITLVETGRTIRQVGDTSTASEEWLQTRCIDFLPPKVEAPCGTGKNAMYVFDGNDLYIDGRLFDDAAEMVVWTLETIGDNDDLQGRWYGWDGDSIVDPPDMTVTMVDGELVWAEA